MKVAIAGYGIEGRASYDYYVRQGHEVTIVDEQPLTGAPKGAAVRTGPDSFRHLDGFDLVIRTAGLVPTKIATDGKIWSATNEFFARCETPIIGVTGTKGKGTTASFIESILRAGGLRTLLVGNIGRPALDVLDEANEADVIVYELSSFQLWDLERSPHIAVILMVEPDHLDVHASLEDYYRAKANIVTHQTADDILVYHRQNEVAARVAAATAGTAIPYGIAPGAYVKDDWFYYNEQKLCSTTTVVIPGEHNLDNACAAITAAWTYIQEPTIIAAGLAAFKGLPHRLKLVREVDGISYYDDSIATTPGSALAALASFSQPKVIILGGSDKGSSYDQVVMACRDADAKVVAIGDTGERIAQLCEEHGVEVRLLGHTSMHEIVETARTLAERGGVVIMSPASASFDMFRNYADRGEQFVAAVSELSADVR